MSATALTLHITGDPNAGYQIACRKGVPKIGAGAAKDTDKILAGVLRGIDNLDPQKVSQKLADPEHTLADIQAMGAAIGDTFLNGNAGAAWRKERDRVLDANNQWSAAPVGPEPILRTYFHIEPLELQVLPWETCRYANEGMFFHRALPVTRAAGKKLVSPAELKESPVRVLAVIGTDDSAINAVEEVRELRRALRTHDHSFDVEVFDCAAESRNHPAVPLADLLKQRLQDFKPHIFHFAGHAYFDPAAALELRTHDGDSQSWNADEIGDFFSTLKERKPRLVFLNACRTHKPPANGDSFARSFSARNGTLALISMCGNVKGAAAGKCASLVFASLAEGDAIDQAVGSARAALGSGDVAAYYPALSVLANPDELIFVKPSVDQSRKNHLELLARREPVKQFVDRIQPRRQLFSSLEAGSKAIAVVGDRDNGKTWFLTSVYRCLAWRGHSVTYVNLTKHKTWNSALWAILDGGDEPQLSSGLSSDARKAMETFLGTPAAPLDLATTLPTAIKETLDALRSNADGQAPAPILILDHLEPATDAHAAISTEITKVFNYFFDPVARGDGRIRLILSCGNDSVIREQAPGGSWQQVDLKPFPAAEVKDLMRDWFLARNPKIIAKAETYLQAPVNKPKSPRDFAVLCEAYWKDME